MNKLIALITRTNTNGGQPIGVRKTLLEWDTGYHITKSAACLSK